MTTHYDFVILGGGPAGLGAAYRLADTGRSVCVVERELYAGGLASSFEVAGVRVDHGSHRLHPTTPPPIMALLRELLGADLQRRPRHGRIRMAQRFVAFPPKPTDLIRRLPPRLSSRLAVDVTTGPFRRAREDTFAEQVRASLGPTLAARFYAPYVEKLFGASADELSGELARRRVGARSSRELVRRVVRPDPERRVFYYPRRGYGQIPDVLADAGTARGAHIELGTEVVAIDIAEAGITVRTAAGAEIRADALWSTLPLALLARLAAAPDYVTAAADQLELRALVLVYLALPVPQWTDYDAHYFPEADVALSRTSEPKNYRESKDDPKDVTVLCAEVPCTVGDETFTADTDDLAARIRDDLARSALATPEPIDVFVKRVARAYPVYRIGYREAFDVLDGWASRLPNCLHFGRQGLFAHDNTHHALAMAWAATDAVGADGSVDRERWADARRVFASHVVED